MRPIKEFLYGDNLAALLIKAALGSAGLRIASMLLSFLVGILLAQNLGAAGYGIYALVMAITALLTVPTEFGLPSLMTREIAATKASEDWARMRGILTWANQVVLVLSLSVLVIIALWMVSGGQIEDKLFLHTFFWALLLIPLVALSNLRGATLRGLELIIRGQLPELVLRPGLFVLLLVLATSVANISLSAANAMSLHVIATAVAFFAGTIMLFRSIPTQCRAAVPITEPKKWASSAFPMALTEGMRHFQGHFAVLLLGWFSTQSDIGLYRVAEQVGILVALPASVMHIVVAPFFSRLHAGMELARLGKVVSYASISTFIGSLTIFLIFFLFGQELLESFFGSEFASSYDALLILCSGQLVSSLFGPNATLLNMTHHERLVTRAFWGALILSSITGIILVPIYGVVGAALTTVTSLLTWSILMWHYSRDILDIDASVFSIGKYL